MEAEIPQQELADFTKLVKEKYNYDFTNYAASSLKRRLVRILELFQLPSVKELSNKISNDKVFLEKVVKEITVNTTEMFRDTGFWLVMKRELPKLFAQRETVKIWHAGCSTGDEVLTMCILLKELGLLEKAQLHATDLNEDVLNIARNGWVFMRNMDLNQANYKAFGGDNLNKYYKEVDDKAVFDKSLIANVNFFKRDLVLERSAEKYDMILCRNVLIYFNLDLQDRVVQNFADVLSQGGLLAIGSKETISWCKSAKNYEVISNEEKVYRRV